MGPSVEDVPPPSPLAVAATAPIIVVIVIVAMLVAPMGLLGVLAAGEQLLELAAIEPDAAAAVTTIEGDAVSIDLVE